jgi:2,4-dienoyl-CoA reductase-like NADH-dependent reductase (Old Yellow Enzyme family)
MAYVSQNAVAVPGQLGIYGDNLLPGLKRMAEFVHREGCPVIIQLVHSGLFSSPLLIGGTPLGPSVLETPDSTIGKEMSKEEIIEVVNAFRDAAVRAKDAGFDGVQIHAAHGWLLSQFLSPFFNKRTDEYGGSIENRARIVMEVTRSIKEAVGNNFAVIVKINSDDFIPGSFGTDEMLVVSAMLEKAGVDAIEISGGTIGALMTGNVDGSFSPVTKKDVYYREAARRLKEKVKIPVILVGGIRTFEAADEIVKSDVADYVSLCRPLIREPGLIKRWKSGDLRKSECVSDSACFQPGMEGKGVHCVHVKGR